jgi:hypothetical protein
MKYFSISIFSSLSLLVHAADVTWVCSNGNWNTPACWSTGNLPTLADRAIISSPDVVEVSTTVSVFAILLSGSLDISGAGVLPLKQSLT